MGYGRIFGLVMLFTILTVSLFLTKSLAEEIQIPPWIKNNAKWWSEGQIGNNDFVNGIQYLIQAGMMKVPQTQSGYGSSQQIPSWIKNNAGLWANGTITDNDFVKGIQYLIQENIIQIKTDQVMVLSSSAFENNGTIPSVYTCDGPGISPSLEITNVPKNAQSLALIVEDPDAPRGTVTHWIVWNISPQKSQFTKGEKIDFPQGITVFGTTGYGGPCPPSGTHRYFFKLYALDTMLDLVDGSTKDMLVQAMNGHILEQATLMGKYSRT
ncbi:MAG TPA: YbhB/YbcL family Raf kinase inhibitor-like protein [Nitrosopumilaceae archaeon]|nr:YbhB/YbcL family Raf kinase inhibitor-like protein [Nitrosopumilaceae archaeon]